MGNNRLDDAWQADQVALAMDLLATTFCWSLALATIGNPVSNRAWAIFLGCFLAAVALGLFILSWTRWGQSKLLTKCIAIAMLAHIWLLLYAYGTRIPYGTQGDGNGTSGIPGPADWPASPVTVAWTPMQAETESPSLQEVLDNQSETIDPSVPKETALWNRSLELPSNTFTESQSLELEIPEPLSDDEVFELGQFHELTQLQDQSSLEEPLRADLPIDPAINEVNRPEEPGADAIVPIAAPVAQPVRSMSSIPERYRLRFAPDRLSYTLRNGGDVYTEQAVARALEFLARTQSPDGSWSALRFGAGQSNASPTRDAVYRANTGKYADTAMTGLALLAFLGAGHTHTDPGPYSTNVTRGLGFLIEQQFPSGDLSGRSQIGSEPTVRYSRMYSHGIAGIALAEAYAITQDPKLLEPIRNATAYTIKAMNPKTGGWRYDFASEDPGDTSQFGWQAMLLSSASSSNASPLQGTHRVLLQRFLDSVSTGRAGGLAVYRNINPQTRPGIEQASVAMTAEALAMRAMLDLPISAQAIQEAQQMMLDQLPGRGEPNFYYWYYATLALHQTKQSSGAWTTWNEALKSELLSTQVTEGDLG
ncbi:MAG: prenyltransferase/squalene oxidase repeat-containing protein, partial [Pirellula sp.]